MWGCAISLCRRQEKHSQAHSPRPSLQVRILATSNAVDSFPLMSPGKPPVALPEPVDLTPAPRDPAQMDSDTTPTM